MKTLGIIAVKKNSNRFPGKNIYEIDGAPMFWHNVQALLDSDYIDDVYVATDSDYIKKYCLDRDVPIVCRGLNASIDEQPILDVLKYAYMSVDRGYKIIATILPNTINHTQQDVNNAIEKMLNDNCHEVRSFNEHGDETGIIILKEYVLLNNSCISSHIGAIKTHGREIHYEYELDKI